jgi:hypothetical protein
MNMTLAEYDKTVETLTPFQKRILETVEKFPNEMANTWEVAWNGFSKEWNAKRSAHGAIFRCIIQAAYIMEKKGVIVILSPKTQHDTYVFSSQRKWYEVREQRRSEGLE